MTDDILAREYDLVIVGGGTAGCVLAARLSADDRRSVLLLEAGRDLTAAEDLPMPLGHPSTTFADLPDTWRYDVELVSQPSRRLSQFRGRLMGGSSSINRSLFVRGVPEDYDSWGSNLWSFDQVLPYFKQIETDLDFADEFHGTCGPLHVARAMDRPLSTTQARVYETALAAGCAEKPDVNHPLGDGIGRMPTTVSTRSTALTHLGPARGRPNLTIASDAIVTRVIFEGTRAVGVEGIQESQPFRVRGRQIILSCGTFGSPELLLRSGIGPSDELAALGITCVAHRPGVGRNVRCHPLVTLQLTSDDSAGADPDAPRLVVIHSASERNNVMIFPNRTEQGLTMMVTLRRPTGSGELKLQSADPRSRPAITYGYLQPLDMARLRDGLLFALGLADRAGANGVRAAEILTEQWILEHLDTADHTCGTCKLGQASDPLAVVDETCRVHEIENLRVVDLSIVPHSVRAGPYPTVVMLAERAVDLIDASGRKREGDS
jgi:choline dehydrogenase